MYKETLSTHRGRRNNGITKQQYQASLNENIEDLVERLKKKIIQTAASKEDIYTEKCAKVKIADPNIIRLIVKFLKARIMEDEEWEPSEVGTPQGSIASPVLANIHLHYVLDLWFEKVVKANIKGEAQDKY